MSESEKKEIIALIGLGTIGLSFAALHLRYSNANLRLYDVRSDLTEHIERLLPVYLESTKKEISKVDLTVEKLVADGRLLICSSIEEVCSGATIVQEQGPDSVNFKKSNWTEVVKYAPSSAHLWSSTSGISASRQVEDLEDKTRVLVVHPFNPPHIMPLIEVVPSPHTEPERTQFAIDYFKNLGSGHRPVRINKETQGFVGNRLAFALFREACHLVSNDVVSVEDLDTIVEASIAPRWAVAGPFKTYNSAGGIGGIGHFCIIWQILWRLVGMTQAKLVSRGRLRLSKGLMLMGIGRIRSRRKRNRLMDYQQQSHWQSVIELAEGHSSSTKRNLVFWHSHFSH
ncbi:hydroxylacyl dehydrogenase [Fusarium oxysporum]|nr:hydroxylacyl dehydrogenase [Fusarium oxysporum]